MNARQGDLLLLQSASEVAERVLTSLRPEALREEAAAWAGRIVASDKSLESDLRESATRLLTDAVNARLSRLADVIIEAAGSAPWAEWVARSGADHLYIDELLANELEVIGAGGATLARKLRSKSAYAWSRYADALDAEFDGAEASNREGLVAELFRLWAPEMTWVGSLAKALWLDRVAAEVREKAIGVVPAGYLAGTVKIQAARLTPTVGEQPSLLLGPDGLPVGRVEQAVQHLGTPAHVLTALNEGRWLSAAAHRLLRWLVREAREQTLRRRIDLSTAAPRIVVPGGMEALAEAISVGGGHTANVVEALDLFQWVHVVDDRGGYHGGLLTWSLSRSAPGARATLTITPSEALLAPGSAVGRKLVPVPRLCPPLAGSANEHASLMSLQLLVFEEFRSSARQLATEGGIQVPSARWKELAEFARVRERLLGEILHDLWLRGDSRNPAFLVRTPQGLWQLADAYASERDFLVDSGKLELEQSRRGKRSAKARRGRR